MKIVKSIIIGLLCLTLTIATFAVVPTEAKAEEITTEDGIVFDTSTGTIIDYTGSETTLDIPSSINGVAVKAIGFHAFCMSNSLQSLSLPGSVISIGKAGFANCRELSSINMPNSITSIGDDAFVNCDNLVIRGFAGSLAQIYANDNSIPFTVIISYINSEVKSGKLIETTYGVNGKKKVVEYHGFDDSSGVAKITNYNSETGVKKDYTSYDTEGRLIIKKYLYNNGKQKKCYFYDVESGKVKAISEYDTSGRILKKTYYRTTGGYKRIKTDYYSATAGEYVATSYYDENGIIIKKKYKDRTDFYIEGTGILGARSYYYKYSPFLMKKTYFYSNGKRRATKLLRTLTKYHSISRYNTNGDIKTRKLFHSNGVDVKLLEYYNPNTGLVDFSYYYDTEGNKTKKTSYYYEGLVRWQIDYYDLETGKIGATSYYNGDGIIKKTFFYDSGVRKQTNYYNLETRKIGAIIYYDTNGDITKKVYYNSDGSVKETINY